MMFTIVQLKQILYRSLENKDDFDIPKHYEMYTPYTN